MTLHEAIEETRRIRREFGHHDCYYAVFRLAVQKYAASLNKRTGD